MNFVPVTDLTKAEQAEVRRLCLRHRDIRVNGAGALEPYEAKLDLQRRRQEWVDKHRVECFSCGQKDGEWAKLGVSERGRRWAICQRCVWNKPEPK